MFNFALKNRDGNKLSKITVRLVVITGCLVVPLTALAQATGQQIKIPFEVDSQGNPILPGQIIDDEYSTTDPDQLSVEVSVSDPIAHPAIIFNSADPTGGDVDLGSPNNTCSPPGLGEGISGTVGTPGENCQALGNILILAENITDMNGDGLVDDPDDYNGGGMITFTFNVLVQVDYLEVLDIDENGLILSVLDVNGDPIRTNITPTGLGNNSYEEFVLGDKDVKYLVADFPGSGALASIAVTTMKPLAVRLRSFGGSGGGNDVA
ncbi:MAG: hypothetical protein GY803_31905, partial [Chloroflexi bacterium]|nr:hypothetical protein [Chloroflexota bacterium]